MAEETANVTEKQVEAQVQTPPAQALKQEVQASKEEVKETQEQINWREFRKQREIERKQKEESDKRAKEKTDEANALKAAMETILNKQAPTPQLVQEAYYPNEESEDERINKKVIEAIQREKNRIEKEVADQEIRNLPKKIKEKIPDFEAICTQQNLDYLEFHYPEVAAPYQHMPDSIEKWENLTKAVKRFVPQGSNTKKEEAKLQSNQMKPQSLSSATTLQGGSQKAPIYLDDARRQANWERMQKQLKGVS